MEALFLAMVNRSIAAGWLILAVWVLHLLFRKAPGRLFCLLWAMVAIRLLVPNLPISHLSLIPQTQTIPANIAMEQVPHIESGMTAVDEIVNPVVGEIFAPSPAASANPLQVWIFVAARLWIAVAALLLVYAGFRYVQLKHRLRTATRLQPGVRESEAAATPFVFGFLHPRIYLPYHMPEKMRSAVLLHEEEHIRHGDPWWKLLSYCLLAAYWFHPLMWVGYILFGRDVENACDERAIRDMNEEERRSYSAALLQCSMPHRLAAAYPLAFGEIGVKERILRVMNYKKPSIWVIVVSVLVLAAAGVGLMTNPAGMEHPDPDTISRGAAESVIKALIEYPGNGLYHLPEMTYIGLDSVPELETVDSDAAAKEYEAWREAVGRFFAENCFDAFYNDYPTRTVFLDTAAVSGLTLGVDRLEIEESSDHILRCQADVTAKYGEEVVNQGQLTWRVICSSDDSGMIQKVELMEYGDWFRNCTDFMDHHPEASPYYHEETHHAEETTHHAEETIHHAEETTRHAEETTHHAEESAHHAEETTHHAEEPAHHAEETAHHEEKARHEKEHH